MSMFISHLFNCLFDYQYCLPGMCQNAGSLFLELRYGFCRKSYETLYNVHFLTIRDQSVVTSFTPSLVPITGESTWSLLLPFGRYLQYKSSEAFLSSVHWQWHMQVSLELSCSLISLFWQIWTKMCVTYSILRTYCSLPPWDSVGQRKTSLKINLSSASWFEEIQWAGHGPPGLK